LVDPVRDEKDLGFAQRIVVLPFPVHHCRRTPAPQVASPRATPWLPLKRQDETAKSKVAYASPGYRAAWERRDELGCDVREAVGETTSGLGSAEDTLHSSGSPHTSRVGQGKTPGG
jgi:hypothetical protein